MRLTPDGVRYVTPGPVPRPFNLRWLIPAICQDNPTRWEWVTRSSVVALAPLAWWFTGSPWMAVCVALPGVWFNWRLPALVDAPGMMLALLAACLWPVCWPAAIAAVLLAGCVRETTPAWAAIYAWHPALLVGFAPVAIRLLTSRPGPDPCGHDDLLAHPIRSALSAHRGRWGDPALMVAPWGPLVVGVLAVPTSIQLSVALVAAYGQTLTATDTVRLYQWAWPVVALATAHVAPEWLPLVAVGVVFNPFKGDGL